MRCLMRKLAFGPTLCSFAHRCTGCLSTSASNPPAPAIVATSSTVSWLWAAGISTCARGRCRPYPPLRGSKLPPRQQQLDQACLGRLDCPDPGVFKIAELQTAKGTFYLLVASGKKSNFAFIKLHLTADKMNDCCEVLAQLTDGVPLTLHTVLTDNRIQFIKRVLMGMLSSTSLTGFATSMPLSIV